MFKSISISIKIKMHNFQLYKYMSIYIYTYTYYLVQHEGFSFCFGYHINNSPPNTLPPTKDHLFEPPVAWQLVVAYEVALDPTNRWGRWE